jgi:hypothetical protein
MYSNVGDEENIKNNKASKEEDIEGIEKRRMDQCLKFLNKLNLLFWDKKRWKFLTNEDGTPFLNKIFYCNVKNINDYALDSRFLCIFRRTDVPITDYTSNMNPMQNIYMEKLFTAGWDFAMKVCDDLTMEGSHQAQSIDLLSLLKHLNLKLDGTDVVVDIGYGTSALLMGLATLLNGLEGKDTRVYGSEKSENVFKSTEQRIDIIKKQNKELILL